MTKWQKKDFVEKIERICAEIGRTGLTSNVIEDAQSKKHDRMIERFEAFIDEHIELAREIRYSHEEYEENYGPEIFFIKEEEVEEYYDPDDYYCVYDPAKIDPMDLLVYLIISDGTLCYQEMFSDETIMIEAIRKKGFNQIADYMEFCGIYTSNDLLESFG